MLLGHNKTKTFDSGIMENTFNNYNLFLYTEMQMKTSQTKKILTPFTPQQKKPSNPES